jgi:tetratricopeptide (TPR) repeat protein
MPDGFSPAAVRSIMADALAQFDGLTVLDQDLDRPLPGREHYELKLRAARHSAGVHVTVRLTHRPSRQLVWSREFDARMDLGPGAAERDMARAIGVAVGQPYGVIFSDMRARAPAGSDGACLILAHDARFRVSAEDHARARDCLEAAVAANPSYHLGYAMLAGFYLMEHKAGLNPRPNSLDRALRAAQRAVELAPQSPRAHFAMMNALFVRGETEAALREGHLSVELNPYNSDLVAELGARYVQLGRYAEGLDLLERAIRESPGRPPWYDFFKFVALYMEGDFAAARAVAETFVGDAYFYGPLARGLVAYRDGDEEKAKAFVAKAAALVPHLMGDPGGAFRRYGFCPAITERLTADLGEAGLQTRAN